MLNTVNCMKRIPGESTEHLDQIFPRCNGSDAGTVHPKVKRDHRVQEAKQDKYYDVDI